MSTKHHELTPLSYEQLLTGTAVGGGINRREVVKLDQPHNRVSLIMAMTALYSQKGFFPKDEIPTDKTLHVLSTTLAQTRSSSMDDLQALRAIRDMSLEELLASRQTIAIQMGQVAEERMLYVCGLNSDRRNQSTVYVAQVVDVIDRFDGNSATYEPVVATPRSLGLLPRDMIIHNGIYVPANIATPV